LKVVAVTLYCFLVSVCSGHFSHQVYHPPTNIEANFHASSLSTGQLFHHFTSSFSLGVAAQTSSSSITTLFNEGLSFGNELWSIHFNPLSRFKFWSQGLIIHLIREVIIFPFHDFW